MSASTVAAIGVLVDARRELTAVLAEHLDDNEGEVLPLRSPLLAIDALGPVRIGLCVEVLVIVGGISEKPTE